MFTLKAVHLHFWFVTRSFKVFFFKAGLVSSKYLPEKWEKPQGTTVPFPFFIDNIKSSSIYNPSSKRLGHFKMEIKTKCNDLQIP